MKKIIKSIIAAISTATPSLGAGIEVKDLMGNPMEMLNPMLSEVRWLFGTVYGLAFVVVLMCIVVAIIKAAYGSLVSNPMHKQEGKSAAIEIVGVVFVGIIATIVVVFLFNTFIFK